MNRAILVPFLLAALTAALPARADYLLPTFDPANFDAGAAIDNPYLSYLPGMRRVHETKANGDAEPDAPAAEHIDITFEGPGPVLAGVQTTVVLDRVYAEGLMIEETRDFYAQDRQGNVWYLGEDVVNLTRDATGAITGTDTKGSWRAGVNGAEPGYAMPAVALLTAGFAYQQEHAPQDQAMDRAEVLATGVTLTTSMGTHDEVISILETSAVDPDLREVKHFAPGLGLLREEEVAADLAPGDGITDLIEANN